ncbi:DEAD-box protein abstrakt [Actinidia rufa]|uniref:DEAD-box protein abstrakt n=1 Tax=Actinidia rufa TaxID=165716 RepID=A0A7J0G7I6_9ERIC|nr:DEAD-box protein abstrakt [Actinidia rufa]
MDKNWMKMGLIADGRISRPYFDGLSLFIQFARAVIDGQGNIPCPCLKCVNFYQISPEDVRIHLLQNGIMQSYIVWHEHGEPRVSDNVPHPEIRDKQDHDLGGIDALVEDRIRAEVNGWYPRGGSNLVPKSTYEARKILFDLGLSYELIDACINDCVLFWKENAMLDKCPRCNVSRYKINCGKGKKIPHKILRYFPLTPRLKRLFMSRTISEAMRWHMENPGDGEESRHPAQSDEWKDFDVKHPEFALKPRNVRLGLAVDGFNPFGNMSNSYSMWPVILVPYNLPPWLAMKDSFFMLTLLVPGEKQPGIDIDVYMRPMVDEFKRIVANCKTVYINHRCYLPENHPEWRKRVAYNGKQEKRKRSLELPVGKIQEQLNNITGVTLGKYPANKKRPCHKPNWTKLSILYELPYFRDKKFRHNIDVMHGEKNFSENLIGTMLGIDGKNKDTDKARKDLEDKGIRKELWLTQHPNGSYIKPHASFSLTIEEREAFFEFLKSVKYPDGYAANISRRSELEKLEERIVHILCKLENIFPPAFFNVMVHLAIHLPREALLGGPVQYRWMYPFERFLGALKKFVSNRARPEGSIAEAYIVKEYYGPRREGYRVFTETARPIGLITRDGEMSQELRDIAHWFVLFNSSEIKKYLEEHNNLLHVSNGQNITNIQRKDFPKWFKEQINRLRANNSKVATDDLWSLANGPNLLVEYSGCIVNGVRFRTRELDNRRKTQNSGVLAVGDYEGKMHNFYGHLINDREFEYMCQNKVILFQCDWYNTGNAGRNCTIRTDKYCTSINVKSRWYQSDPFIFPSYAKQVFYLNDTKWGKPWQVVQLVRKRGVFDVTEVRDGEPLDPEESSEAFQQESITSTLPIDIEDNIQYHREDVEVEVIERVGSFDETREDNTYDEDDEDMGDNINNEAGEDDEIPDADDMDPDMDYDM